MSLPGASGDPPPPTGGNNSAFKKAKVYVHDVRRIFIDQAQVYQQFLVALNEAHEDIISNETAVLVISHLFREHQQLLAGLEDFIPNSLRLRGTPEESLRAYNAWINDPRHRALRDNQNRDNQNRDNQNQANQPDTDNDDSNGESSNGESSNGDSFFFSEDSSNGNGGRDPRDLMN